MFYAFYRKPILKFNDLFTIKNKLKEENERKIEKWKVKEEKLKR